jgi:hypothetical protein
MDVEGMGAEDECRWGDYNQEPLTLEEVKNFHHRDYNKPKMAHARRVAKVLLKEEGINV